MLDTCCHTNKQHKKTQSQPYQQTINHVCNTRGQSKPKTYAKRHYKIQTQGNYFYLLNLFDDRPNRSIGSNASAIKTIPPRNTRDHLV